MAGVLITGTDTGIGKTLISCALARCFRDRGIDVGVMKPVASGGVRTADGLASEDAVLLCEAARVDDPLDRINPVVLAPPLAPVPAAAISAVAVDLKAVVEGFRWLSERHEIVLVEGVGGVLVPLVRGVTVADLARRLDLPAIVVSRTDLGTVNHTLLTIEALQRRDVRILGVVFNRLHGGDPGDDERTGPDEVFQESGTADLGRLPYHADLRPDDFQALARSCEEHIALDTILNALRDT